MVRFTYGQRGFTVVEVLIAVVIMALVITGAISIYMMSITAWREGSTQIALQRTASIAMEKMVRGIDGRNGIREASSVTRPNDTTIKFTSGIDAQERSFYLSGSEIIYDPDTSTTDDEFPIVENIRTTPSGLTFVVSGAVVTINLGMQGMVRGKAIDINLSTSVKLRN